MKNANTGRLIALTLTTLLMFGCSSGGSSSGGGTTVSSGTTNNNNNNNNNNNGGNTTTPKSLPIGVFAAGDEANAVAASVPATETSVAQQISVVAAKSELGKDLDPQVAHKLELKCLEACQNGVQTGGILRRFQQLNEGDTVTLSIAQTSGRATVRKMHSDAETLHCTIFAEPVGGVPVITKAQALQIAQAFDSNNPFRTGSGIYDQVRAIYGTEWTTNGGRDGDPKINLVILSSTSIGGSSLFGFFSPADEYPASQIPESNQGEFLYLNVAKFTGDGFDLYSTIAHEFQHMVSYNTKLVHNGAFDGSQENVALDEGRSVLCEDLCGFGLNAQGGGNRFIYVTCDGYLRDMVNFPLFTFGSRNGDYGKGYLLLKYLHDRFGLFSFAQVMQTPNKTGLTELNLFGDFPTLFADWATALKATNLTGNVPSQFRYASGFRTNGTNNVRGLGQVSLPGPQPTVTFNPPNGNPAGALQPYVAALYNFSGGTGQPLNLSSNVASGTKINFLYQSPAGNYNSSR